jgi:cytochrome P450
LIGVHFCLGAMLARQEMKCAIREVVKSLESLEWAVAHLSNGMIILARLEKMPVRLRKRAT